MANHVCCLTLCNASGSSCIDKTTVPLVLNPMILITTWRRLVTYIGIPASIRVFGKMVVPQLLTAQLIHFTAAEVPNLNKCKCEGKCNAC